MKSWLQGNDIEMYSTQNEGKSVATERFIRTLKNKLYKYLTLISKNVYIDKLNYIVDKYNKTYHRKIKTNPVDIKGALSGLRQFLTTESPLKMMKNVFYFTSKALFVLKIFKFLS